METLKIYQGNDFILTRQITASNDNTLLDLTEFQLKLGITRTLDDLSEGGDPTYVSNDFPILSTLVNENTRAIILSKEITSVLPAGAYFYEIQIIDESLKVFTGEIGKLFLLKRVVK